MEFSLFLALAFLVSPMVHEFHYLALYPAIIMIWFRLPEEISNQHWLFILSYLLLGVGYSLVGFPRFHSGLLAVFTTGKLAGVIILFLLIGKILRRETSNKETLAPMAMNR